VLALMATVLTSSLLGSTHCAGMCGAFVAVAAGGDGDTGMAGKARLSALYHAGRLVTYVGTGVAAGALGSALDVVGGLAGFTRAAAVVAGAAMVVFGLMTIARQMGRRVPRAPLPRALQDALMAGHRWAYRWSPGGRALIIGLLTTLLPCGWLWAFVIVAAGTGHPGWGGATMAVFWMGTLPALAAVGAGAAMLTGALRGKLAIATSVLVVAVGVATMLGRLSISPGMAGALLQPRAQGQTVDALNPLNLPCGVHAGAEGQP
jgi:sulfite exporter TauE/SafE